MGPSRFWMFLDETVKGLMDGGDHESYAAKSRDGRIEFAPECPGKEALQSSRGSDSVVRGLDDVARPGWDGSWYGDAGFVESGENLFFQRDVRFGIDRDLEDMMF